MSRFRTLAAGALIACAAVVMLPQAASAHDQLVSSSPQSGERLDAAPASISLEFSGDLLVLGDEELGATLLVVDANGEDWLSGSPDVDGRTVSAELSGDMPEGGYELRWQVVSSDGHPISGVVPFTVGDAEPLAASAGQAAGAGEGTRESQGDATQEQAASTSDASDESSVVLRRVLLGAGGAALAVVLFVLIRILRRRTRGGTDADVS